MADKPKSEAFPTTAFQFQAPENDSAFMKKVLSDVHRVPDKEPPLLPDPPHRRTKKRTSAVRKRPDDVLDLHGKLRYEALIAIENFVVMSSHQKLNSLLIITGKGNHSGKEGPVLKVTVEHWLKRKGTPYVQDFQDAPSYLGGSGALWVDLYSQ